MKLCDAKDGDLWWQCVRYYMPWHNVDQASTNNTVSVCVATVAVVPADRAAFRSWNNSPRNQAVPNDLRVTHFTQS